MVKCTTKYYCDACGKDITKEYIGEIQLLVKNDYVEEIEPEGKIFCEACMKSFSNWMKERKALRSLRMKGSKNADSE